MAHDVFISYSSKDKIIADAVCARLEAQGIRCWIAPRDVNPGRPYAEEIILAIETCTAMVLVFSSNANASLHIPKEIERAVSHGIPVIPLRTEVVQPSKSLDYFIGSVHWLDAITPPLEKHLETLANTILRILPGSPRPASPSAPARQPGSPAVAPVASAKRTVLLAGIGAGVVVLAVGIWFLRSKSTGEATPATTKPTASPVSAQNDAAPPPEQPKRGEKTSTRGKVQTAEMPGPKSAASTPQNIPASPVKVAASPVEDGLVGCWLYNTLSLRIFPDGQVTGFLNGGRWSHGNSNQYLVTWPKFVDTVKLSQDGRSLTGSDIYGGAPISAQRLSGGPQGFPGLWQWNNGLAVIAVTVSEDGSVTAGPLNGKWTALGGQTFRVSWTHFPIDQVEMSADRRTLSGQNQWGFKVAATRVPCPN